MRGFESVSADIGAAIDALLAACPGVRRVVLWGLCDGASASLLYWSGPPIPACRPVPAQPVGALGGRPGPHPGQALLPHRLRQPEFWRKLASGRVAGEALPGRSPRCGAPAGAPRRGGEDVPVAHGRGWDGLRGRLLLVLSGNDYTAKEFLEYAAADAAWRARLARPDIHKCDVAGADHTFSGVAERREVESRTVDWMCRQWPRHVPETAPSLESADECN